MKPVPIARLFTRDFPTGIDISGEGFVRAASRLDSGCRMPLIGAPR